MKQLSKEFTGTGDVKGFIFTQLRSSEKAFLYKVNTGNTTHWEVFERRVSKAGSRFFGDIEVKFEEKEKYPKSEHFGDWAWCCTSLKVAEDIYEQLQ